MFKMFRAEMYRFFRSIWNLVIGALFISSVIAVSSIMAMDSGTIGYYETVVDTSNLLDYILGESIVDIPNPILLSDFEHLSLSLCFQAMIAAIFSIIFIFAVVASDVNSKHMSNAITVGNTRASVFGSKLLCSFIISTILLIIEVPVILILFRSYGIPIVILPAYFIRIELAYLFAIYIVDAICLAVAFSLKKFGNAIVISLAIIGIIFAGGYYFTSETYSHEHYYTLGGNDCFDNMNQEYFMVIDYGDESIMELFSNLHSEGFDGPIFAEFDNGVEILKVGDTEIRGTVETRNPNYRTGLGKVFFKMCVHFNPVASISEYMLPYGVDSGYKYMYSQSVYWICEDILLIGIISIVGIEIYKRKDI